MIAISIVAGVVALLIAGAVAGERKHRAGFGHISRRDLLKYKLGDRSLDRDLSPGCGKLWKRGTSPYFAEIDVRCPAWWRPCHA